MCFPCWKYEDVYFEERPKPHKVNKHPHTGAAYAGYYIPSPMLPAPLPRAAIPPPIISITRPIVPALLPVGTTTGPATTPYPGYQAGNRFAPANGGPACGWGQYQTTWPGPLSHAQQEAMIHARSDNRPQDMQPSDPDPWRFYTVKEQDGGTTSRNKFTIDSGEIGKIRWYQTPEGVFYAKVIEAPKP